MSESGERFRCRKCGEIYPYRPFQLLCPLCKEICNPVGKFSWEVSAVTDLVSALPEGSHMPQGGRVAHWAQRLLDLSLGNRLLNLKDSNRIIPLLCSDLGVLEDRIAANGVVTIHALSGLLGKTDYQEYLHGRLRINTATFRARLERELDRQHRLWTTLTPAETQKRLTELYRLGKQDLQDSGVNTLFLALGLLEWKQTDSDEQVYRAPILLVPVRFERRSIADGIRMKRLEDETILNVTLIELLRSQFGITVEGVDPLPVDAAGVAVEEILGRFRKAIAEKPGWSVVESCQVGQFSFDKFVMWKDLTARLADLGKNKLVSHLISGKGDFDDGIDVFPAAEVSRHLNPNQLFCPLSADSSQLAAILYSAMGKTFVLHGPPGTGKSQTITNLIAHNLALGRKVLFVSEKKTALDVVYKRLKSLGLAPFCLELHSNKSGKKDVLKQFAEALKIAKTSEPQEWKSVVARLQNYRAKLNGYVSDLHHKYPNGLSAYDCFCDLMRHGESSLAHCIEPDCTTQTQDDYHALEHRVSELADAGSHVNFQSYERLSAVKDLAWTPSAEHDLETAVGALRAHLERLDAAFEDIAKRFALDSTDRRLDLLNPVSQLLVQMLDFGRLPPGLLTMNVQDDGDFLAQFGALAQKRRAAQSALSPYYLDALQTLDVDGVKARIRKNAAAFAPVRSVKNHFLLRELRSLKKPGGSNLNLLELSALLPKVQKLQSLEADYRQGEARASRLLGELWNDGHPVWKTVPALVVQAQALIQALIAACPGGEAAQRNCLATLLYYRNTVEESLANNSDLWRAIRGFLDASVEFHSAAEALVHSVTFLLGDYDLPGLRVFLSELAQALPDLRGVLRYREARMAAELLGAEGFALALERGDVTSETLVKAFYTAYCTKMLNAILEQKPSLAKFTATGQEDRIRKFCDLDAEYTRLTGRMVFAKVAENLPKGRTRAAIDLAKPLGILRHECEKQARHLPVRQLLSAIGPLAGQLKPCFLMSPLSVAQYLPADANQFDLIVFDEASQIPVWDAIGVIARANQVIIVGDQKQMPPTTFFQKGDGGAEMDDEAMVEDLESILDECLAAGVYSAHLNWHYRSRHESLISFSNHYFYGDRLLTFPSASKSPDLGVSFEFVSNGIYDRKASRTNRREAETIVDYIFWELSTLGRRPRSMGVVTFNEAQKRLIEDLIERRREQNPDFEDFFADQKEEPFFVKNLENVQGDERDIILFSVCYAADSEGSFTMNFGPLNKVGGERRLNVAVTRAKEQIVLFASIHASQIDLSRTQSKGVALLKAFIDYAEKGMPVVAKTGGRHASENFAAVVSAFLKGKGYKIAHDIGLSDRKIDIAVRDPRDETTFLLGIECDGPSYAAPYTARDRDVLRTSVLHSLGWKLCKVWSIDWTWDRAKAEARLLEQIREAMGAETDSEQVDASDVEEPPAPAPASAVVEAKPVESHLAEAEALQDKTLGAKATSASTAPIQNVWTFTPNPDGGIFVESYSATSTGNLSWR